MIGDHDPAALIATLRIELLYSDPLIWREIEVPVAMTLTQLHGVIQAAMAWEDDHLWEFSVGRESLSEAPPLHTLLRPRKTRLLYTYDFGDSWEHALTITRPRVPEPGVAYPCYLGGERAAPPEDCGGISGFYARPDILADPTEPDHEEVKEWLGDYDPNRFDEEAIKRRLARMAVRKPAPKTPKAR